MNINLSKRGDYVVRSALCLATNYDSAQPIKLRQISLDMGVPRTFVSQILGDLVTASLATSYFGANGGYRLSRPPSDITVLEVVEAGEGPLDAASCVLGDGPCQWESVCPLHETWTAATAALKAELASTTLATLAERDRLITAGEYHVLGHARGASDDVQVADVVHVELPLARVAARLARGGTWLIPHFDAARDEGEELVMRVGPGESVWLAKTVAVHLGEPVESAEGVSVPLRWEATGPAGLFPRLVATLSVHELDPERSELTLSGRYRPPLGRAGHALDGALGARVARATVRSFLRRLAAALEEGAV
ncbi:MAG TPA: Rrf2 family transcriptional regulator [Acidimicrobiales bacterium]|nr:Rrf2 family transcriptional regulator [Acidimicrobiales bacterium]